MEIITSCFKCPTRVFAVFFVCIITICTDVCSQSTISSGGTVQNKVENVQNQFVNITAEERELLDQRMKYDMAKGRKTPYSISRDYMDKINAEQMDWKAGVNFCRNVTMSDLSHLVGAPFPSGRFLVGLALSGTAAISGSIGLGVGAVGGVVGGGAIGTVVGTAVGGIAGAVTTILMPDWWWDALSEELMKQITIVTLPREFDGREDWPSQCRHVVSTVGDTGICSSSWALSVAQAVHDRYCIFYKRDDRTFSAKHLLDCCPNCGHQRCKGGNQEMAYEYLYKEGVPTGMNKFASRIGCQPYSHKPSNKLYCKVDECTEKSCSDNDHGFQCNSKCSNKLYEKQGRTPDMEMFQIYSYFYRHPRCMWFFTSGKGIKAEILLRGSITAVVTIFDDFLNYKKGVYYPTKCSERLGDITMRILGWGEDNGVEYWLAANVWGTDWGDGGFVKLRAWDESMNIESRMMVARIARDKCVEDG